MLYIQQQNRCLKSLNYMITIQKNFTQQKNNKHTMCEYSFFAPCLFDSIKSKHDFYRGTDCMIKVCADLRKHATEIINYEKKENLS